MLNIFFILMWRSDGKGPILFLGILCNGFCLLYLFIFIFVPSMKEVLSTIHVTLADQRYKHNLVLSGV